MASGTPRDEIRAFCQTFIHPDDRDRFMRFYDLDTLDERLSRISSIHLADTFFVISDSNRYVEQVFMLIPLSLDGHKQYLSCMRDVDMPEYERSHLSGYARISDEVLLSGLFDSSDLNIFWKDERRRFVGANESFLEYFGFKDVEDIFGKTDEELSLVCRTEDTPAETIEKRLEHAAAADLCIVLYNPSSKKRTDHLKRACKMIMKYRKPETVCGTAKNIGRDGEESRVLTLAELAEADTDMFTTVFVGNSETKIINGRMVVPRGYKNV
jgi:hypothetical protein